MAKVLVAGGAGYVGSAACAWLLDRGHDVWILDDLSTGHRELVLSRGFTLARVGDQEKVGALLEQERFDCLMHFAAFSLVGESVQNPGKYFENNVEQTRSLLEMVAKSGVKNFVFSSTCAVFGNPGPKDIDESIEKNPINPYGQTKLEAEKMLAEFAKKTGLRSIALRYFNAAGAEPKLRTGEWHTNETHLIPNILKAALNGQPVQIFGNDYKTPDGTCIRDYVHISDLAKAHEAAMLRLLSAKTTDAGLFEAYNLGSSRGFSVLQLIEECEKITGLKIDKEFRPRRPGDPPRLVANSAIAKKILSFETSEDSLQKIITSAYGWEKKLQEPKSAIFLDRDGTLNDDPGYLRDPEKMILFPGVGDALVKLKNAGFQLIVISNQSGVGRGLITEPEIKAVNAKLDLLLSDSGIKIDHYELCFHRPDENCACRKPKPKMLLDAAKKFNIDLSRSFIIGDKKSDLDCGRSAGPRPVLVRTGHGRETEKLIRNGDADFIANNLGEAATWILANCQKT